MENNCFTPEKIAHSELVFSIPLYQRLFEWGEAEVMKLLEDLWEHYDRHRSGGQPYYFGMLTVHKGEDGRYDLVDGQQRFTVMVLMGIVCGWSAFLESHGKGRLDFYARDKDKEYLVKKIRKERLKEGDYKNLKMERALSCIENEFQSKADNGFKDFIYKNLTFFLSELPVEYKALDLNRYFETMNSAGRGLESHEILKVELLKKVNGHKEEYTRLWNAVSRMDKMILPKSEDKPVQKYHEDFLFLIRKVSSKEVGIDNIVKELREYHEGEGNNIGKIEGKNEKPGNRRERNGTEGEYSIISFPELLLLVLDIQQDKDGKNEFYKTDKLLERFKEETNLSAEAFFKNLLLYRLLLDFYVIRIQSAASGNRYNLEFKTADDGAKECLMYQSMLYVSTDFYRWVKPLLKWLKDNLEVQATGMLSKMKTIDWELRVFDENKLSYGEVERYWFWYLDYCLWEEEWQKKEKKDKLILDYVFRRNRSIEHLHPQNQENNVVWETEQLHAFGNLAMISPGLNSVQSNDNVHVKFGRIKEQIERETLESIKLYKMFLAAQEEESNWSVEVMQKHQDEMLEVLKRHKKRE